MDANHVEDSEVLQRMIARTIAVSPSGRNLMLIGGFRYRFLDNSVRVSRDVDYHWNGDLAEKRDELMTLFRRTLLPEVRRILQYEGSAGPAMVLDEDSTPDRTLDLAFWKPGVSDSRIVIPVTITRIAAMDPTVPVVKDGTVYPTTSEKDMVESKVIALVNRVHTKHRDFVDVFLFQNQLSDDSRHRLSSKFSDLGIRDRQISKRMSDFTTYRDHHAKAIQAVIDEQLEPAAADTINDAGGGKMILDAVLGLLDRYVLVTDGGQEQ